MISTVVCIVCPVSCEVKTEWDEDGVHKIEGNLCRLALEYVEGELFDPRRTVTTSVPVDDGDWPLVSVRTHVPIPKAMLIAAMDEITGLRVSAPVKTGDVILADILGTGANVIATREVASKDE